MILYTCPEGLRGAPVHPCARAMRELDRGGHTYERRIVKGGTLKLWTLPSRARDRTEIERLSGQRAVPILVLDDGEVVTGSGTIARWAVEHPATAA